MLDALQPGRLPPMLRAERDLARARLAGDNGAGFAAAITGLRELSTPYHLAHGLLDYAAELDPPGRGRSRNAGRRRRGHRRSPSSSAASRCSTGPRS